MKKFAYLFVLITLGNLILPRQTYAQIWVQAAHLGDSGIVCIQFLDKQGFPGIGVAGTQDGKVFRTADYGRSWQSVTVTLPIKGPVTSFVFKDALNGWLSCRQLNKPGIYETHDGGNSWTQMSITTWGNRFDVGYNPFNNRLFMSSPTDNFRSSADNGVNWSVVGPSSLNGIAFSTSLIGVVTCFSGLSRFTHDGGSTWLPSKFPVECWNPLAAGPTIFFAVSEANWSVYCTTDGGNVWEQRGSLPRRPTGDIRGLCGQLYVQTDSGFYYSNDEGFKWHPLLGPGNQSDSRFYTVGTTIYAGDQSGFIYKLEDVERGPEGRIKVAGTGDTVLTVNCSGLDTTLIIQGLTTCLSTKLLGYTYDSSRSTPGLVVFQPAGPYKFYDTAFFHDRQIHDLEHVSFPYTFNFDDTSFVPLHVQYRPSGTQDSAVVTLHYQIGAYLFDTAVVIHAMRDKRISVLFNNAPLILNAKSACRPENGVFTALNGKCDSVKILSVRAADSVHFHVLTKLPATLLPFGSLPIVVSASGETKDTFNTTMDIVTEVGGVVTHLTVNAELHVPRDGPVLPGIPRLAQVAPTNICAKRLYTMPIHNLGCYRMIVEAPHWIIPIPELTILREPRYPDTLNPGESDSIVFEFAPDLPTTKTAILGMNIHSASSNVDTSVQIHTSAYDLSKATLSATSMQFDSLLICNESVRSVFIRNESCKPTRVVRVDASTYLDFISASPAVGSSIGPGDSVEAMVRFKPRTPGDKVDSVTFFFEDSSKTPQALTVALHGFVIPDVPRITMSTASIGMNSLDPCSDHDTVVTITNVSVCDSITIQRAVMVGSSWFTVDSSQLPVTILPLRTVKIPIHIQTTSDSASSASVHIFGVGMDTTLALDATTAPIVGDEILATNTGTVFKAKLCSSDTKRFTLHNRKCEPIEINELRLSDMSGFSLIPQRSVPFTIPANSSISFDILFNADDTTARNGTLHYSTTDGKINQDISIGSVTTTRPQVARLSLSTRNGSNVTARVPGDTLSLALISETDVPDSLGLIAVASSLAYDHNLLTLESIESTSGWSTPFQVTDDLRMTSLSAHTLSRTEPLAILHFSTNFAEPRSTQVQLSHPSLNDSDLTYARCMLTSAVGESVTFSVAPFCGDSLYGDALLGLPVSLGGVEAKKEGGGSQVYISLTAQSSAVCHFSITDIRGAVVNDLGRYTTHEGAQDVLYPIRVTSGSYVLIMETSGRRMAKKFSITK